MWWLTNLACHPPVLPLAPPSAFLNLHNIDYKFGPRCTHGPERTLTHATHRAGYFSKELAPVATVASGDEIEVEMATHHACDDWDKMIKGDAGMESIFTWDADGKSEDYRGATGGGDGVHVLTGPIFVTDAEPGDILKVEILDLAPRPNADGKTFGSNAAAWWGFQARVNEADGTSFDAGDFTSTPASNDEVVTIYEIVSDGSQSFAVPSYQMDWPTLTDPDGVTRNYIKYPGTCVPHDYAGVSTDVADMGWTKAGPIEYSTPSSAFSTAKIPINYHVGCMGLPPASHTKVDSIPPMPTGGNLDDKRIGIGTTMYYPVEVAGALLSMGDAHAAQGDSELDGTGIETSITGNFRITLIKAADFEAWQTELDFPLGETDTEWIVHGFTKTDYLEAFDSTCTETASTGSGADHDACTAVSDLSNAVACEAVQLGGVDGAGSACTFTDKYRDSPGDIYGASNIDDAMKNAFTQTRKFMMNKYSITDAEATTLITQGVDFGTTQLVDGNWGVHAVVPKVVFSGVVTGQCTGNTDSTTDVVCTPPAIVSAGAGTDEAACCSTPEPPVGTQTSTANAATPIAASLLAAGAFFAL